jgi:hypothetical protein
MIARTKVGAMLQDPVQRDRMTRGLGKARNPPATQDVLLVPAKAREASLHRDTNIELEAARSHAPHDWGVPRCGNLNIAALLSGVVCDIRVT